MKISNPENYSDWNGALGTCRFCNTQVELTNEDIPNERMKTFQVCEMADGHIVEREILENPEKYEKTIKENPFLSRWKTSYLISQIYTINRWKINCPKCEKTMIVGTSYPCIGVSSKRSEFPTSHGVVKLGEYKIFQWKSVLDSE